MYAEMRDGWGDKNATEEHHEYEVDGSWESVDPFCSHHIPGGSLQCN